MRIRVDVSLYLHKLQTHPGGGSAWIAALNPDPFVQQCADTLPALQYYTFFLSTFGLHREWSIETGSEGRRVVRERTWVDAGYQLEC